MIQHHVMQGDSLWRLAHRYLGRGTRWPLIHDFHNANYKRINRQPRLIPIRNENLIYVGQTVLVPPRTIDMPEGNGTKKHGAKTAMPIDLKVEYTIGRDTPPLVSVLSTPDFTATTELTGTLGITMLSPDSHYHNLELAFGQDPLQIKSKLKQAYDPAVCALTMQSELAYESGRVKVKSPLFAEHDNGACIIRVQADSPTHLSGSLNLKPFSGQVTAGGRQYRFDADIELKAAIDWHPISKGKTVETETVKALEPKEGVGLKKNNNFIGWEKVIQKGDDVIAMVCITILGIIAVGYMGSVIYQGQTTSIIPFLPGVDPNTSTLIKLKTNINA